MKKLLAVFLVIAMVFSLAACGASEEEKDKDEIQVDENLINVDITLPADMFEGQTDQEIVAEAEEGGYKCVVNEDGTVKYTMTKKQQKELLQGMKDQVDEGIQGYLEGEDEIASFEDVQYNNDLTKFTIKVNENYGDSGEGWAAFSLLLTSAYYQRFAGVADDDMDCVISYVDAESGEELDHISLKELSEANEAVEEE